MRILNNVNFCYTGVLSDRPTLKQLNRFKHHICTQWYDVGLELFNERDIHTLKMLKANNPNDSEQCCIEMLNNWLERSPSASWEQLIDALKSVHMNLLAAEISKTICDGGMKGTGYDVVWEIKHKWTRSRGKYSMRESRVLY